MILMHAEFEAHVYSVCALQEGGKMIQFKKMDFIF